MDAGWSQAMEAPTCRTALDGPSHKEIVRYEFARWHSDSLKNPAPSGTEITECTES